jgi:pheromone shutdown protein TraB
MRLTEIINYFLYSVKRDAPLIAILAWLIFSLVLISAGLVCAVVFAAPLWLLVTLVGCLVNPFTVLRVLVYFYMFAGALKKKQDSSLAKGSGEQ